jgi:hypothetical protein
MCDGRFGSLISVKGGRFLGGRAVSLQESPPFTTINLVYLTTYYLLRRSGKKTSFDIYNF